jgi:hypothetical protein
MHELRLLNEHDASQLWQFRLTGLEECPQAFTESADELQSSPVDVTVQRLRASSEDNFVLGAFGDGRLIGTVGFFETKASRRITRVGFGVFTSIPRSGDRALPTT